MDERAALCGVTVPPDGFVFSLEPDCLRPMEADYLTKQVARLKDHLGIADKRPETIVLEDEALRLHRSTPAPRRAGRSGPAPAGGMSYKELGRRLGRSERWAQLDVAPAERREAAAIEGRTEMFDGSIIVLREFTSSELLDAGFNLSAVAQRQGHGPQALVKHYAKARPSADRKGGRAPGSGRPWRRRRSYVVRPDTLRRTRAHVALARVNPEDRTEATMRPQRLTMSVEDASEALGISRSLACELVRRGEIPSLRLGRRIVVPVRALEELVRQAGAAAPV
jgi:excisionase family DNA binding protein